MERATREVGQTMVELALLLSLVALLVAAALAAANVDISSVFSRLTAAF
jgi:Flp pilus assembly pilin Flp